MDLHSLPSTYQEARRTGNTRYFTGKPCIHGHLVHRCAVSMVCVACVAVNVQRKRDAIRLGLRPKSNKPRPPKQQPPAESYCSWLLNIYADKIRSRSP